MQEKPAFKNAIRRRRCLVPADGYYEWQTSGGRKQPYFIHRRDGAPMGLAGLAETWMGPNGEELDTVALITAEATTGMSVLHHRVPVTIAPAHFGRWLDCSSDSAAAIVTLLAAPADGTFAWHPVSSDVNKVANDDAQLILPISAEAMAAEQDARPKKAARKAAAAETGGQGSLF